MLKNHYPTKPWQRRNFLKKLGLTGASASMMSAFLPILNASGQESTTAPTRLILWSGSDGMEANWRGLDSPLLSRLNGNDIVSVYGIRHNYGGGGEGHMQAAAALWAGARVANSPLFKDPTGPATGGWAEGPSIDQVLVQNVPSFSQTPFRSVALGVGSGEPHTRSRVIYTAANQPVHPETSVLNAFTRVFGNGSGQSVEAATLESQRASIELIQKQLSRLKPRIAQEENYKIEAHQDGLASIARRLDLDTAALGCQASGAGYYDTSGEQQTEGVRRAVELMTDLIVQMLVCDQTRVVTFQMLHTLYQGALFGHGEVHAAHHGRVCQNIDEFYIDTLGTLIEKLKAVPEAGGSLFDNTLIVHGRDLGDGNHSKSNIPYILAGGAGGKLTLGRHLEVGAEQAAMLVTIGRLMGMDSLNSMGNIQRNTGPINEVLA